MSRTECEFSTIGAFVQIVLVGITIISMNSGIISSHRLREAATLSTLTSENWQVVEALFDQIPDIVFFVKDKHGRYLAINQSFVERCGLHQKSEITGRSVTTIFPADLAARYTEQDEAVLKTGRPILDRLEMHWRARRRIGWCLTCKFPLRDTSGEIVGLAGISRDVSTISSPNMIPPTLAESLAYLEKNFSAPLTPTILAKHARIPAARFARLIKKIFHVTPSQLITQTRLAAAARMLESSRLGIAEIAIDCGFYDHSAFTRAFRSATGKTPSQFREGAQTHLAGGR